MSRSLSISLQSYLAGPMLALCNCILIRRLDGKQYGFTSLDQDVTVNGIVYEAFSSADLSDVSQQEGAGVDNLSLLGLLTSTRIVEADLEAGLWDGAAITLFTLPFEQLSLGTITLLTGYLGDITHDGASYTAEVRSLSQRLAQQIVELTSNLCRVRQLFDSRCMPKGYNENGIADNTLTPASFRYTGNVAATGTSGGFPYIDFGATTTPAGGNTRANGVFSYGRLLFNTGLNQGLQREIKSHTIQAGPVARMVLQEGFPFLVSVGDNALFEVGCDRRFSTCRNVFANSTNFQAEPHLPGNDSVIQRGRKG